VCSTRMHNLCGKDALRYTAHLYARLTSAVTLRLSILQLQPKSRYSMA
jgi:hypothetical protein